MPTWFLACALLIGCPADPAPTPADPCVPAVATPGPLTTDPSAVAPIDLVRLRLDEAEIAGDPAWIAHASLALACARDRSPGDSDLDLLAARIELANGRFDETQRAARSLMERDVSWESPLLLGDALRAVGRLEDAEAAYVHAERRRGGPTMDTVERRATIAALRGDAVSRTLYVEALDLQGSAVTRARVLTRLGWLDACAPGAPPGMPARLDEAVAVLPDYAPARLARGRVLLHAGDAAAAIAELERAGPGVEAARALAEARGASADEARAMIERARPEDERAYAEWLVLHDPVAARPLLDQQLATRADAETRVARAYAIWRGGDEPTAAAEATTALASGSTAPRVLMFGGLVLGDRARIDAALRSGPGLLPSERRLLGDAIAGTPP